MAENSRPTQCDRIIAYIEQFGAITAHDAMIDLGVMRLASRIHEIKLMLAPRNILVGSCWEEYRNRYGEPCRVKKYFFVKGDEPFNER